MIPVSLALLLSCARPPQDSVVPVDTGTATAGCVADHPDWTVGLLHCTPEAEPGYTLFAPLNSRVTYLIDLHGQMVHSWESAYLPAESVYLEPSGHLLRTAEDHADVPFQNGGAGGRIEELDWDGEVVWSFTYKSDRVLTHHDVERLPDGHVLAVAWEALTEAEAIAAGRNPGQLTADGLWAVHVIEIDPATNDIVWEWHVLDHVVQDRDPAAPNYGSLLDNPGKVDIDRTWGAFGGSPADWNHVNSIDYNEALDQILLSAHNQDEIWVIDHGISTEEARGPAGDLLYRWGSPANYGAPGPQRLSGQHDAEWIPDGHPGAGNILVFNNGNTLGRSAVLELEPPLAPDGSYERAPGQAFGPDGLVWSYDGPPDFFSGFISGSQRLPGGNTLVCEGDAGRLVEVTPDGRIVWEYIVSVGQNGPVPQGTVMEGGGLLNAAFRADRYPPDHPAFAGRDLSPKGTIEK